MATEYKKEYIKNNNIIIKPYKPSTNSSCTGAQEDRLTQYDVFLSLVKKKTNGAVTKSCVITFTFFSAINLSSIPLGNNKSVMFSGSRLQFNQTTSWDPAIGANRTNLDEVYFTLRALTDIGYNGQWTLFRCSAPFSNTGGSQGIGGPYDLFDISGGNEQAFIDLYSSIIYTDYNTDSALVSLGPGAKTKIPSMSEYSAGTSCKFQIKQGATGDGEWTLRTDSYIEKNFCKQNYLDAPSDNTSSIDYGDGKIVFNYNKSLTVNLPTSGKQVSSSNVPTLGRAYSLYKYNIHFKITSKSLDNSTQQFFSTVLTTKDISGIDTNKRWDSGENYTGKQFYDSICKPLFNTTSAPITFLFGENDGGCYSGTFINKITIQSDGTTRGGRCYGTNAGVYNEVEYNFNDNTKLQVFIAKQRIFDN